MIKLQTDDMPWVRAFLSHRKGNVDRKGAEEGDALALAGSLHAHNARQASGPRSF